MLILFYGKKLGNVPSRAQGFTEMFLFEPRIKDKLSKVVILFSVDRISSCFIKLDTGTRIQFTKNIQGINHKSVDILRK